MNRRGSNLPNCSRSRGGGGGGISPIQPPRNNKRGSMDMLNASLRGFFQPQNGGNGDGTNGRRSVVPAGDSFFFDKSLNLEDALAGCGGDQQRRQDFRSSSGHASFHRRPNDKSSKGSLRDDRRLSTPVTPRAATASTSPSKNHQDNDPKNDSSSSHGHSHGSGLSAAAGVAQLLLPQLSATARRRSSLFSFGSGASADGGSKSSIDDDPYAEEHREGGDDEEGGVVRIEEGRLRTIYDKIHAMRSEHDSELRKRDEAVDALTHENETLRKRLDALLSDADDRHTVSEYAKLITESMPPPHVADSTYVLKLQSQLCRALHKMGMLENQLDVASQGESDRIKALQSKLHSSGEESFQSELQHMNELMSLEKEMQREREEAAARLAEKERELDELRERLELEREAHRRTMEAVTPLARPSKKGGATAAKVAGGATELQQAPSSLAGVGVVNRPFVHNHAA